MMYLDYTSEELYHFGVKGMRWGHRKHSDRNYSMISDKRDSSVTRKTKKAYQELDDVDFKKRYHASKKTYAKRVDKYGDPYMHSPLAKTGKYLAKRQREQNKINPQNKNYSLSDRKTDRMLYSSIGEKSINKAMNKGKTHAQASRREFGKQALAVTLVSVGSLAITNPDLVREVGRSATEAIMKKRGHTNITWL